MDHINKNDLIDYFYEEIDPKRALEIEAHLEICSKCESVLAELRVFGSNLDFLPEKQVPAASFENVLANISMTPASAAKKVNHAPILPFVWLGSAIAGIVALVYFLHDKLSQIQSLQFLFENRISYSIGSLAVVILLFMAIGVFLGLAIAPILILDEQKSKSKANSRGDRLKKLFPAQLIKFLLAG